MNFDPYTQIIKSVNDDIIKLPREIIAIITSYTREYFDSEFTHEFLYVAGSMPDAQLLMDLYNDECINDIFFERLGVSVVCDGDVKEISLPEAQRILDLSFKCQIISDDINKCLIVLNTKQKKDSNDVKTTNRTWSRIHRERVDSSFGFPKPLHKIIRQLRFDINREMCIKYHKNTSARVTRGQTSSDVDEEDIDGLVWSAMSHVPFRITNITYSLTESKTNDTLTIIVDADEYH